MAPPPEEASPPCWLSLLQTRLATLAVAMVPRQGFGFGYGCTLDDVRVG